MESREQQGHSVQIEMEKLNGEQSAEPVPSHSSLCLKIWIVLVSVVGLLAVIVTCLLFNFVFQPVCGQDIATPPTAGKINKTFRLQEFTQQEGPYNIFEVDREGEFWIHGWLNCSKDVRDGVFLHQKLNNSKSKLKPDKNSESMLYFNNKVWLLKGSSIILSGSQLTDGFFYLHEL